ncbi:MAG: hypothetical protein ABI045_07415 [Flavobacteriales bacterium]
MGYIKGFIFLILFLPYFFFDALALVYLSLGVLGDLVFDGSIAVGIAFLIDY